MRRATLKKSLLHLALLGLGLCLVQCDSKENGATDGAPVTEPIAGSWNAWLDSPGGELAFGLELKKNDGRWQGWLINGTERISVPRVSVVQDKLTMFITHYDSKIEARLSGHELEGQWRKRAAGADEFSQLAFHARRVGDPGGAHAVSEIQAQAWDVPLTNLSGRWKVDFESSDDPAIGIFKAGKGRKLSGTFLTDTGDYRFLAGTFVGDQLTLSCFDGAHAFLFRARLQADGRLTGDFWSRDSWHETWIANRDRAVQLQDPLAISKWQDTASLEQYSFPDTKGVRYRLDDPMFAGKARLIEVFGTWCPNCRDATNYMVQLYEKYNPQGLSVIGLAFELTGDFKRDAAQVESYVKQHGIQYPVLVAGLSDKKKASQAFPALDRVHAYPTTIFLDANNKVRAVYTGFSGPATGEANAKLRKTFESLIESLLSET